MKMHLADSSRRLLSMLAAIAMIAGFCIPAQANSGIQMPLGQIQAGTEHTGAIISNGGFESVTSNVPNNWLQDGNMRVSAPQNPPPNNPSAIGSLSAQALANQPSFTDPENYHYTTDGTNRAILTFDQTKNYVISGYLWNYGRPDPSPPGDTTTGDLALAELDDVNSSLNNVNVALEAVGSDGGSAAGGYFIYQSFAGSVFPNGAFLDVRGDLNENLTAPIPNVYAQFDNIAITPAEDFLPPTLVPEPATLGLLAMMTLLPLRRRVCE
jgi:hypothetical protein